MGETDGKNVVVTDSSERELRNRERSRVIALDGAVLLENDGCLPIHTENGQVHKIALYGSGARMTVKGGTGSGDVNEREIVTIEQGLINAGFVITTKAWLDDFDRNYHEAKLSWRDQILSNAAKNGTEVIYEYFSTPFEQPSGREITKEDIMNSDTDTAIYVVSRIAGEGADRKAGKNDYQLSDQEEKALYLLSCSYRHLILVINTGGMIDLSILDELNGISAVLYLPAPGMEAGNVLASLLTGKVTPSGKLTDTWAKQYEDYPFSSEFSHNNGNVEKEYYREGIFTGYRYFDSFGIRPRYCFGYGLSYTSFSYEVNECRVVDGQIEMDVKIQNTGEQYFGKEVLQFYVGQEKRDATTERRKLAGFVKTESLAPGEIQFSSVRIMPEDMMRFYGNIGQWALEAGNYTIYMGDSLDNAIPVLSVQVPETIKAPQHCEPICPLQESLHELNVSVPDWNLTAQEVNDDSVCRLVLSKEDMTEASFRSAAYSWKDSRIEQKADEIVGKFSVSQLTELVCGASESKENQMVGGAAGSVAGAAGETTSLFDREPYNLPEIVLADGPAGLRLNRRYQIDEQGRVVAEHFMAAVEHGLFQKSSFQKDRRDYYQMCTAFPVGTMVAQSWNLELTEQMGKAIGEEMEEYHVTLWLAPGMNIHRNPLCGRNFEYYSEDPFLTGKMAAAMTRGVQSNPKCGVTIKHFACNNAEDNRMNSDSIVSERTLREIYLRGFEIVVKEAEPLAIMSSYNKVNGVHAANNHDLCMKVARREWGFEGLIMTDWTTTNDGGSVPHKCITSGNDLIMPGKDTDRQEILQAVASGQLGREELFRSAKTIARVILKTHLE